MGLFDLFSKKQRRANQAFLADQRSQQVIAKIKKLDLPAELKQQLINAKVYDIWFNSKDLAPLSNLLSDHEKIEYAALGITDQGEDVMLTCTNQNLIILSKKHPSENSRVIPLTEIMSVLLQQQIISEELTLIVNNEQVNINLLNRTTGAILTGAFMNMPWISCRIRASLTCWCCTVPHPLLPTRRSTGWPWDKEK